MRGVLTILMAIGLVAPLAASGVEARELRMIAPLIPPHFDEEGKGRIGDVIRATLDACGHDVAFTMVPFGRHWKDYEDYETFDGLATAEADQTFPGFTTRPFIHLQDGATVHGGNGLDAITSVDELHGRHIVAFPNADTILGIEESVPQFKSFKTRSNRFDQVRSLLSDRADAVLADGLITAYFLKRLRENIGTGEEPNVYGALSAVFRRIFAAGPQRLYFRDSTIARDFDRCYRELVASGEVGRITKPYVDEFREILKDQYPDY